MVCAMVFSVRMAESGRSISCFRCCIFSPQGFPSWTARLTVVGVMVSSEASRREQRKEKTSAMRI